MPSEHNPFNLEGSVDLNSLGAHSGTFVPPTPMRISQVGITITGDASSAGEVQFRYRPTAGSTTGEVTFATVPIPANAVQGQLHYIDLNTLRQRVQPGGEVVVQVSATAGAGATGKANFCADGYYENPLNVAAMVGNATV